MGPLAEAGAEGLRGARPAGQGRRRQAKWVFDGHTISGTGAASVIGADMEKRYDMAYMFGTPVHEVAAGASQVAPRLEMMDAQGIWAHLIYPNTVGFGGQQLGGTGDLGAAQPHRRDLQRRDGRDAGRVGQPAVPAGDPAVVGRRPVPRRDRTDPGPRARGREHQLRPAGRRPPRPQPAALGSDVGGARRRRAAGQLPHRRQRVADHLPRVGAVAVDGRRSTHGDRLGDAVPRQRPDHRQPDLRRGPGTPSDAQGGLGGERRRLAAVVPQRPRLPARRDGPRYPRTSSR